MEPSEVTLVLASVTNEETEAQGAQGDTTSKRWNGDLDQVISAPLSVTTLRRLSLKAAKKKALPRDRGVFFSPIKS